MEKVEEVDGLGSTGSKVVIGKGVEVFVGAKVVV